MLDIELIKETISKQHEGDERQLSVIFLNSLGLLLKLLPDTEKQQL